jgi:hypothetical protein
MRLKVMHTPHKLHATQLKQNQSRYCCSCAREANDRMRFPKYLLWPMYVKNINFIGQAIPWPFYISH